MSRGDDAFSLCQVSRISRFPLVIQKRKCFDMIPNRDELDKFSVYLSNNLAIHVPRKEEDRDLGKDSRKVFKNMSSQLKLLSAQIYLW